MIRCNKIALRCIEIEFATKSIVRELGSLTYQGFISTDPKVIELNEKCNALYVERNALSG